MARARRSWVRETGSPADRGVSSTGEEAEAASGFLRLMIRTRVYGYVALDFWTKRGPSDRTGAGDRALQVRAGRGASLRAERASGDRRVTRRAGEGRRRVAGPGLRRPARISVISTLVALAVCLVTAASACAFTAQGSAKQVYVTGLDPNAQASLLNSKGKTVYTQNADSLGGLLFRNVAPGTGYRVLLTSAGRASGPITVP